MNSIRRKLDFDTSRKLDLNRAGGLLLATRVIDRIGRVLLCLVILGAAVFCLRTVQAIRSTNARDAQLTAAGKLSASADSFEELLNGNWQFADTPWSVHVRELPQREALARLNAHVVALHAAEKPDQTEKQVATDPFLPLLELLNAQPDETGFNMEYRVAAGHLQAVAFAPKSQPRQIQLVRAVQPVDSERWNFIELIRNASEEQTTVSSTSSLLPRGPENITLAVRCDAQSRLYAELIELHSDLEVLKSQWKQAGWQVSLQSAAQLNLFGAPQPLGSQEPLITCTLGNQSVFVISPQTIQDAPKMLLLIRSTQPSATLSN